ALEAPDPSAAYTVFAQRGDAALELASIKAQASRFFAARLGLTVDKRIGAPPPAVDAARVVVATDDGATSGTHLCFGRPATALDHAAAGAAERAQGTSGLSLLAQRCRTVWLVTLEVDDDRPSLLIAAVLASV